MSTSKNNVIVYWTTGHEDCGSASKEILKKFYKLIAHLTLLYGSKDWTLSGG